VVGGGWGGVSQLTRKRAFSSDEPAQSKAVLPRYSRQFQAQRRKKEKHYRVAESLAGASPQEFLHDVRAVVVRSDHQRGRAVLR
jgi:hypothetical protein